MLCGATHDGQVMVERSDRIWSTGEGNNKPLQYSYLEIAMNSVKMEKDGTLKDDLQHAAGDQWRTNCRKNEEMEPKLNNTQLWM